LSPKLPRDIDGEKFARRLCSRFGYQERSRVGSHIVLQLVGANVPHVTIPAHDPVKVGTLSNILKALEQQTGMDRDELLRGL
jgi:predicted RNA binding protein YcfA (HicA-like mRNA interferase family)